DKFITTDYLQQCQIAHQLSIARSTVYKILEDERAS
ncbi:helix-turn-helix domain-containing protein, partial [Escherichia coli]|nr:helix-turn-helix domain-containing protein [Escherichia coli]EGE8203230.1 helix-turn-helix domain-containing protein [Escherichia coli]